MRKVLFDKDTGEVMQWQDYNLYNYAEPPDWADLTDVDEETWQAKESGGFWYIINGQFVKYDERPKFSPLWDNDRIKQYLKDEVQGIITLLTSNPNATDEYKTSVQEWANQKNTEIDNAQTREELEQINIRDYPILTM